MEIQNSKELAKEIKVIVDGEEVISYNNETTALTVVCATKKFDRFAMLLRFMVDAAEKAQDIANAKKI